MFYDELQAGPVQRKYNLNELNKGLYFISIECQSERQYGKFILK
jgi:hypothetical protein